MPFKPNYRQARSERTRAKEQRRQEKQARRQEIAAQRKAERGEPPPADEKPQQDA